MQQIDFFLVGVQKSATTWLYKCLSEHPDILIGDGKEESIYLGSEKYQHHGKDWYEKFYPEDVKGKCLGSASVDYIKDKESLSYIKENNSHPYIFILLRDPIERYISAFNWYKRRGYIDINDINKCIEKSIKDYKGSIKSYYCDLITRGKYSDQIPRLSDKFENICIITYDSIKNRPVETLKVIYEYIGVFDYRPYNLYRRPKKTSDFEILNKLERNIGNRYLVKSIRFINEISSYIFGNDDHKRKVSIEMEYKLKKMYLNDIIFLTNKCTDYLRTDYDLKVFKNWHKKYSGSKSKF